MNLFVEDILGLQYFVVDTDTLDSKRNSLSIVVLS